MKKLIFLLVILICSVLETFGQKVVTATKVNGTWRNGKDEIKILSVGHRKLKVEYSGIFIYKYKGDPIANMGEAKGFGLINGTTANFTDAKKPNCKMILDFVGKKLNVTNNGCVFGLNVTAKGTYKKISSKKPKFDW